MIQVFEIMNFQSTWKPECIEQTTGLGQTISSTDVVRHTTGRQRPLTMSYKAWHNTIEPIELVLRRLHVILDTFNRESKFLRMRISACVWVWVYESVFWAMGVGRGLAGGTLPPPWIFKCLPKKVVFLVSSGKNQISPLLPPLEKCRKNPLVASLEKIFPKPIF